MDCFVAFAPRKDVAPIHGLMVRDARCGALHERSSGPRPISSLVMAGRGDEALPRADVSAIHVFLAVTKSERGSPGHRRETKLPHLPGDDDFSGSVLSLKSIGRRARAKARSASSSVVPRTRPHGWRCSGL